MKKRNYTWHPDGTLASELPGQSAAMDTKWVAPYYEAAHCLYAGRLDRIGQGVGMDDMDRPGDLSLFKLDELEAFDFDYEWQFHVAKCCSTRPTNCRSGRNRASCGILSQSTDPVSAYPW